MTITPLADLANMTEALYQAELAKLHKLVAAESALRADLAALDRHRRINMALPDANLSAPRQIGADVLWHGWVGRSRQTLNQQLALVLAQKGQMMKALRRAHGKQHAAGQLLETARAKRRAQIDDKRNHREQSLLLLKAYHI